MEPTPEESSFAQTQGLLPFGESAESQESIGEQTVILERNERGELAVPYDGPVPEDEDSNEEDAESEPPEQIAGWSIMLLCVGLSLIAACVIIPQADANHRLAYEREKLRRDLDQIQKQVAVNSEFLLQLDSDPQLMQRLIERQMHLVPQGQHVLILPAAMNSAGSETDGAEGSGASAEAEQMSPFEIVNVPPPAPLPAYIPLRGVLGWLCASARVRLYLIGASLFMVAIGLFAGEKTNQIDNG